MNDGVSEWTEVIAAGVVLTGFFTTIIVVVWQVAVTWRARMLAARDQAYQRLAEQATATQQQLAADLAEVKSRVGEIERLLREVN